MYLQGGTKENCYRYPDLLQGFLHSLILIAGVHQYYYWYLVCTPRTQIYTHTLLTWYFCWQLYLFLYLKKKKTYSTRVYTYSNHTHTNDQPHITRLLLFLYATEKEQAHCQAKRWKKSVMERAKSRPQPCKDFCLHTWHTPLHTHWWNRPPTRQWTQCTKKCTPPFHHLWLILSSNIDCSANCSVVSAVLVRFQP